MGDIADMMLDGTLCESCGEYLGDAVGHTRKCSSCEPAKETRNDFKARRIVEAKEGLTKFGFRFNVMNNETHFQVFLTQGGKIPIADLWPTTGKFRIRGTKQTQHGLWLDLVKLLQS